MDFTIYTVDDRPDSTGFIEIVAGSYTGKHWLPGSMLVWDDAFTFAEKALIEVVDGYDHFEMNDLSDSESQEIVNQWVLLARKLSEGVAPDDVSDFAWDDWQANWMSQELRDHSREIAGMLSGLADGAQEFIEEKGMFCVLGV
jgi:hypothetical protein